MKNKKRVFLRFREYEGEAFSQYLEEMAGRGWHFEKTSWQASLLFERGEPKERRYCTVIVPGDTEFSDEERDEKEQFRELCEQAGWNFICGEQLWQIFATDNREAIPIETDLELWVKTVKETLFSGWRMFGIFLMSLLVMLALGNLFFQMEGKTNPETVLAPALPLLLTLLLILQRPAASFFWYRRAKKMLLSEHEIPQNSLQGIRGRGLWETGLLVLSAVLGMRAGILGPMIYLWLCYDCYQEIISYIISQRNVEPEEKKWAMIRIGMVFVALLLGLLATVYLLLEISV